MRKLAFVYCKMICFKDCCCIFVRVNLVIVISIVDSIKLYRIYQNPHHIDLLGQNLQVLLPQAGFVIRNFL
jgi:hypothetical protein